MYERFTDRARKALVRANTEATKLNHEYVGTEHLLIGLMWQEDGRLNVAGLAMSRMGFSPASVCGLVAARLQRAPDQVSSGKLPLTPRSKEVMGRAVESASIMGDNYVGTEHLLLGLLRVDGGIASDVLKSMGVTLEKASEALDGLPKADSSRLEPKSPPAITIAEILAFADRLYTLRRSLEGKSLPHYGMVAYDANEGKAALTRLAASMALMERSLHHAENAAHIAMATWGGSFPPDIHDLIRKGMDDIYANTVGPTAASVAGVSPEVFAEIDSHGKPTSPMPEGYTLSGPTLCRADGTEVPMENPAWHSMSGEGMITGITLHHPAILVDPALSALRAARTAIQALPPGHRARIEEACLKSVCTCFCGGHPITMSADVSEPVEAFAMAINEAARCLWELPADIRRIMQPACHASGGPCWCGLCEVNSRNHNGTPFQGFQGEPRSEVKS